MQPPQGPEAGEEQWGVAVTFDGRTAHQVSEGEVQGPFRGEVGLS